MKVHQVVHYATLQVVRDAIYDDLASDIQDLEVGVFALVAIAVNGLVDLFVVPDPVPEVEGSLLGVLALVVGARSFDVADVGHDHVLVVALGLDKEDLNVLTCTDVSHPLPPVLGGVCCVEDSNHAALLEPIQHVGYGSLSGGLPSTLALGVVRVEEVGRGLRGVMSAVVAHVEGLGVDGEPLQISLSWRVGTGQFLVTLRGNMGGNTFLCYETLASCWQTHHNNADLGVLGLDAHTISLWCHDCSPRTEPSRTRVWCQRTKSEDVQRRKRRWSGNGKLERI